MAEDGLTQAGQWLANFGSGFPGSVKNEKYFFKQNFMIFLESLKIIFLVNYCKG